MIRITWADGTVIEVPDGTLSLEQDLRVRRSLAEVIAPVGREGIESVRLLRDDVELAVVEKADYAAFEGSMPAPPRQALLEENAESYLTILSATFQEGRKWRLSDGLSSFYASLSDSQFLERIDAGESFSKLDVLHCRIHRTQWRDAGGLHSEVDVVQVLEHLPRQIDTQGSIFDSEDPPA